MKPILFRLLVIPFIVILVVIGLFVLICITPFYWIITGGDFLMDKYLPFCVDIYDSLGEKLS